MRKLGLPLLNAIEHVLGTRNIPSADSYVQRPDLWPYPVRLTWTQYYTLTDQAIEAELVRFLREK